MIKIRLETADGSFVADVEIPPFNKRPDVLVWGERFFFQEQGWKDDINPRPDVYQEGFAYFVPPAIT